MASPTPYNVSYSFTGWQAINPTLPLPAASIDVEFANIEASLDSLVVALDDVRRSDGMVQNGSVGWDALDEQVKVLFGEHNVTVPDLDPNAFATMAEAEAGTATDKLMAPNTTKRAINYMRRFATVAEAQTAERSDLVVSPVTVVSLLDVHRAYGTPAEIDSLVFSATKVASPSLVRYILDAVYPVVSTSVSVDFGTIAANDGEVRVLSIEGVQVFDRVAIGFPTTGIPEGVMHTAWVSSADNVSIRFYNAKGTGTAVGTLTLGVTIFRF